MNTFITFTTNIDRYKGKFYRRENMPIPRVGERVLMSYKEGRQEFINKGYPTSLEVVKVTYDYDVESVEVLVELHYNNLDLKLMEASKIQPYK